MAFFSRLRIAVLLALVLVVLAAGWWIHVKSDSAGYLRAEDHYTKAIQRQQIEAANTLAAEIEKTRRAEKALANAKNQQDLKDANHQKTVADLSDRLRTLAGPAGRLRDPHATATATACVQGSGNPPTDPATPAHPGAADSTDASGLLSAQLSGLLRRLTAEADAINNAYASCRPDAYTVRQAPP